MIDFVGVERGSRDRVRGRLTPCARKGSRDIETAMVTAAENTDGSKEEREKRDDRVMKRQRRRRRQRGLSLLRVSLHEEVGETRGETYEAFRFGIKI